ncbi:MAG: DNA-binding protein WhiA [Lachnospiraceae bacterium]|nr:DNA-binding protein WhiA [Lachnospiraceae bacterium]MBD5456645.1 DNA-binding protein WhiA [Lachnospiraceae bacterium]
MSFSTEVKEELVRTVPGSRHCQLAELAAIVHFGCRICEDKDGHREIVLHSENEAVAKKYFTLCKKTFIIGTGTEKILQAIKVFDGDKQVRLLQEGVSHILIKNSCCRRAYLRGAFLCTGSISDPQKGYHLEFVCDHETQALQIQEVLHSFELEAKIVRRKKYYVVYLKEGAGIVDLLNVIGAHLSLMNLENLRIEKEMRNSINRQVNCETANITKTVNAASKQIEDIQLIQKRIGLSGLPDNLREMALVRLSHPESSLQELGGYLNPPVGKSGVNHRLRKLNELAEKIRA